MEPRIVAIPPILVGDMWMHAAPHLLKGLTKATDLTLEQIVADLVSGSETLWCVLAADRVVAAFLTGHRVDDDTGSQFLCVYALGGERMDLWGKAIGDRMVEAARSAGCASVRFVGRDAWSRVLPTYQRIGRRDHEAVFERAAL